MAARRGRMCCVAAAVSRDALFQACVAVARLSGARMRWRRVEALMPSVIDIEKDTGQRLASRRVRVCWSEREGEASSWLFPPFCWQRGEQRKPIGLRSDQDRAAQGRGSHARSSAFIDVQSWTAVDNERSCESMVDTELAVPPIVGGVLTRVETYESKESDDGQQGGNREGQSSRPALLRPFYQPPANEDLLFTKDVTGALDRRLQMESGLQPTTRTPTACRAAAEAKDF
ncbi:uncharacterized protein PV09_02203 [Verruconis gallopava]|uniref:Uncharacterized protein n=1 Tax=Verruconis gallopava TaxID=253628 RepID=A0A0D1Z331_9PEZI|nr:uncharacterized protein PV09_02203 [Verruconis gallopava]KIW07357.1 hypothetical protein PV09_02203 [Verruconis gallopava]